MAEELEHDLRQGVKAAAAAAAVGAAVGMARAIASRAESAAHEPEADEPDAVDEPDEPDDEQREQDEPEQEREPLKGAGVSEVRRLTEQARELLQELSGVEVESVSSVERLDGGWRVTLEAVELRRIPDSTDVLASYAVELDGDGDLVRYERQRRYARSQSDGGDR